MRAIRKAILVLAFVTLLVPVFAKACQTLVVYSSVDEVNAKKILDAFTAQTGIAVQFVHL